MGRPDNETIRAFRRKRRGGIALEDRAITPNTRLRYFLGVKKVLPLIEKSSKEPDVVVSRWLEQLFDEGDGVTRVSDTLSASWVSQGSWKEIFLHFFGRPYGPFVKGQTACRLADFWKLL